MTKTEITEAAIPSDRVEVPGRAPVRGAAQRWFRPIAGAVLPPLAAVLLALATGALILALAGYDPIRAYGVMWQGAFGNVRNVSEVLIKATPLIFTGLGLAVAFRAGQWNIGAEGQFYAGAVASTWVGITFAALPPGLLIPLVLAAGIAGGALWAMLAGYLKVRFGASEVVTTIMLNYLATIGTAYLVTGPMIEQVGGFPQTARIGENAWLPIILSGTRLNIGFLLALLLAVILFILLFRTSAGYAIRAVGLNPEAARYAGINVKANVLLAMGISGGAAGLGGAVEVAGLTRRLFQQISPGYGYDAIAVSLLVGNNPLGVIFSGILFGALRSGSEVMQMNARVPSVLVFAIQGLVILFVVSFGVYRFATNRQAEE